MRALAGCFAPNRMSLRRPRIVDHRSLGYELLDDHAQLRRCDDGQQVDRVAQYAPIADDSRVLQPVHDFTHVRPVE